MRKSNASAFATRLEAHPSFGLGRKKLFPSSPQPKQLSCLHSLPRPEPPAAPTAASAPCEDVPDVRTSSASESDRAVRGGGFFLFWAFGARAIGGEGSEERRSGDGGEGGPLLLTLGDNQRGEGEGGGAALFELFGRVPG